MSSSQSLLDEAAFAQSILRSEAAAISQLVIGDAFHQAVDLIITHTGQGKPGHLVISGIGKSGIIGTKLSATFASTGTPSHYFHATEAMHGDLGRVRRDDIVMLLSFSGNNEEVVTLASLLRQDQIPLIAMVGKSECDLARLSTLTLLLGDIEEACPMNLAPTASTTAMLALGDALALTVMQRRNFSVDDFRKVHPGGGLGRQLIPVTQVIRFRVGKNLPVITPQLTIEQAYALAEQHAPGGRRAGALLIIDAQGKLAGIFTDGDLRRLLIHHGAQAWRSPIGDAMTRSPRHLTTHSLVRDAVHMVREFRIDEIPVVDDHQQPVGLIDVQDLMALKVIEG